MDNPSLESFPSPVRGLAVEHLAIAGMSGGTGEVFIERERLFLYLLVKRPLESFSNPSPTQGKVWERFVTFGLNPSLFGEGLGSVGEGFIRQRLAGSRSRSWWRSAW